MTMLFFGFMIGVATNALCMLMLRRKNPTAIGGVPVAKALALVALAALRDFFSGCGK